MVDTPTITVQNNGYRNVVLSVTLVSDGSGLSGFKVYDATSSGNYGVSQGNQMFYPGIHTTLVNIDYDVQDMKVRVQWEATANQDILVLGNAPEDFLWARMGGLRVPAGLAGATGSILLTTVGAVANATMSLVLYLRKNVPQS
jgi:hypothetical protein